MQVGCQKKTDMGIPCGFVSTLHITTSGLSPTLWFIYTVTKPQGAPCLFSSDNLGADLIVFRRVEFTRQHMKYWRLHNYER